MKNLKRTTGTLLLVGGVGIASATGCTAGAEGTGETLEPVSLAGSGVSATLTFQSDWTQGYCADVAVANTGSTATTTWQAVINLNQSTVTSFWSASSAQSGMVLTATPLSWNAALAPGASTTFGFCANATGSNYHPTLVSVSANGMAGSGGSSGMDASSPRDGAALDAIAPRDAGAVDSAAVDAEPIDATSVDASPPRDAASGPEGGNMDAAAKDAGTEASSVNCSGTAPTGGAKECSSNASGTVNGDTWTLWSSGSGGCMTPYGVGAAFNATWNNSGDFLAREGLQWNSTKTYTQLGTISATFAETKTGSAGGFSYIGIYGWSENPLHEYYIVEDWYGAGPPNPGGTLEGTITVDGGTYKVYAHTQTDQPSITGSNATFVQFFSVRQTARQCGTISISEHFSQWANLGMTLGNMEEAKLLVETGGGSGSITFATGTVTAN